MNTPSHLSHDIWCLLLHAFLFVAAEDHYFYAALSTVRRKIMGMRDSLITSSTWQTKFKRVLEKYPVLCLMDMDFAVPGCDACNLGARMSRFVGRVSGQPYDRSTFEVWKPEVAWRICHKS